MLGAVSVVFDGHRALFRFLFVVLFYLICDFTLPTFFLFCDGGFGVEILLLIHCFVIGSSLLFMRRRCCLRWQIVYYEDLSFYFTICRRSWRCRQRQRFLFLWRAPITSKFIYVRNDLLFFFRDQLFWFVLEILFSPGSLLRFIAHWQIWFVSYCLHRQGQMLQCCFLLSCLSS